MANRNVIMIDDDEDEFLMLQYAFQTYTTGIEVRWFNSPESFLDSGYWQQQPIHLLVLDMNLGGETGKYWQQEFTQHPCCQGVPIVIYSGSEAPGDRDEMISLGVADFITKAATPKQMKQVIERMTAQLKGNATP